MRRTGKAEADPATIRTACEAYARKYIDIQRTQFRRLGVLGDWDQPYLTFDKTFEADELRLFADLVEKGSSIAGKSRSIGVSRAAPPWPRPRSNTAITSAKASS